MTSVIIELLFFIVYTIHTGTWIFILLGGFYNKDYAYLIVYFVIPFLYILHTLYNHPLETIKHQLLGKEKESREKLYHPFFVLPVVQNHLSTGIFKKSVFNPVSHQGLMILSMIINTRIINVK